MTVSQSVKQAIELLEDFGDEHGPVKALAVLRELAGLPSASDEQASQMRALISPTKKSRFTVRWVQSGYDIAVTDDFLERLMSHLNMGVDPAGVARRIRGWDRPIVRQSLISSSFADVYDLAEVNAFLDGVAKQLEQIAETS